MNSRYEATPLPALDGDGAGADPGRPGVDGDDIGPGIGGFVRRHGECCSKVLADPASTIDLVRVGILTGGGDCPGLNAVLRAVVRKGERFHGDEIVGFKDAWDGVREGRTMPLTIDVMRGSLPRGGTVLGTKRGSPYDHPDGVDEVKRTFNDLGIDALIVVGGNGSLTVAHALAEEEGCRSSACPRRSTTTSSART